MADQAAVKDGNGVKVNAPAESMVESVAEFVNDITTLAELQAKLAAADLKEASGRALVPAIAVGAGLVLLLGSLPVVLIGVASLLAGTGMSEGWALLLTGLAGMVIAGVLAVVAGLALGRSFTSFRRSQEELARNVSWVKTVIVYSGRAARNRRR